MLDVHVDGSRSDQVLALVRAGGRVPLAELAGRLGVSEMTIRRDLDALSAQGLLRRVRGAAVALDAGGGAPAPAPARGPAPRPEPAGAPLRLMTPAPATPSVATLPAAAVQGAEAADEDERIATAVLPLLAPGTSVLLDAGPASRALARRLHGHRDLTVAVADLATAAEVAVHAGVRLIVLGGERRPGEEALVGPLALAALDGLSFDTAVLRAAGVQAGGGWTTTSAERADLHRAVLARADRVVLTAASTALGRRALARAGALASASALVTAGGAAAEQAAVVRAARSEGVEVVLV